MAERSDREGWPAARFLSTIAEIEIAERPRHRIERHLLDAIDRLVHDAVVIEMNVESYRQRVATTEKAALPRSPTQQRSQPSTNTPDRRPTCRLPATIWRDNQQHQAPTNHHSDRRALALQVVALPRRSR